MQNFRNLIQGTLLSIALFGCSTQEVAEPVNTKEIPQEVIQKLQKLGINPKGVVPYTQELPEGIQEKGWLSHDIFLSQEDIKTMSDLPSYTDESLQKLYKATNLVNVPSNGRRIITIRGRRLNRNLRIGLRRAVANYNRLNLKFRLELSFGNTNGDKDIVVFSNLSSDQNGIAGFPRNGNPFNRIEIDGGSSSLPLGTIEHLITHELGHCFGLRHSDVDTRSSCSTFIQDPEEFSVIADLFIPGTTSNRNSQSSVMKACFRISETGNFFAQDRKGLKNLYR